MILFFNLVNSLALWFIQKIYKMPTIFTIGGINVVFVSFTWHDIFMPFAILIAKCCIITCHLLKIKFWIVPFVCSLDHYVVDSFF